MKMEGAAYVIPPSLPDHAQSILSYSACGCTLSTLEDLVIPNLKFLLCTIADACNNQAYNSIVDEFFHLLCL